MSTNRAPARRRSAVLRRLMPEPWPSRPQPAWFDSWQPTLRAQPCSNGGIEPLCCDVTSIRRLTSATVAPTLYCVPLSVWRGAPKWALVSGAVKVTVLPATLAIVRRSACSRDLLNISPRAVLDTTTSSPARHADASSSSVTLEAPAAAGAARREVRSAGVAAAMESSPASTVMERAPHGSRMCAPWFVTSIGPNTTRTRHVVSGCVVLPRRRTPPLMWMKRPMRIVTTPPAGHMESRSVRVPWT
mmetsp:Transcript_21444/g.66523  ORF Transcript_21444/g.66523 Transcript_21444/m.66523 type:complete len:245 (-) Transcript_21444:907-1641(-)